LPLKRGAPAAEDLDMQHHDPAFDIPLDDHRGLRQHRFMESADVNAVFRELFAALRANVRRGMTACGQLYAIEMDPCIPGEMLDTRWIPPITRGIGNPDELADPARRRTLFDQLLAEPRLEAMIAYLCERPGADGAPTLYLEIVSVDSCHAAAYPIVPDSSTPRRELLPAPHRRLDPLALA